MIGLTLVKPTNAHKALVIEYKKEFLDNGDSMDGTAGLSNAESYESWLSDLQANAFEDTVKEGLVPASTYLVTTEDGERLVGMIDIRHRLNDFLLKCGGHIGYSIRKSERRKGFATEALRLGLNVCKELGVNEVLVTCDKENVGSAKTVIKNGGILENEVQDGETITQRYWIRL